MGADSRVESGDLSPRSIPAVALRVVGEMKVLPSSRPRSSDKLPRS
ncbi:MAG: hypothetical protein LBR12_02820 [Opitutaceae bacterium]|nr:hypothetical protein [Opitutaceae bacterium]